MPTGPPRADHDTGIAFRLAGRRGHGRTGPPGRGGRYGLLLLVLIGTYLLAAFTDAKPATEVQVLLFALVLLIALRNSPLPMPWPWVIGAVTVIGTAVTFDIVNARSEYVGGVIAPFIGIKLIDVVMVALHLVA